MIRESQYIDFTNWITNIENIDKIKFILSPIPVISQNNKKSFSNFPIQQKKLIDIIMKNNIKNVFIISGGTFCCRVASYDVIDKNKIIGCLTEIHSGSVSTYFKGRGKIFNDTNYNFNIENYNKDNDFPYEINNISKMGLRFVTTNASKTYPEINHLNGIINKIKNLKSGIYENNFVKITCTINKLIVNIYDNTNKNLDTIKIPLE